MHQANQQELDRAAYTLAKDFLLQSGAGKGVTPESIEKYLHLSAPRPDTLAGLYEHMLESAQSGNMKVGVIGGSIGGVTSLVHSCATLSRRRSWRSTALVGRMCSMT